MKEVNGNNLMFRDPETKALIPIVYVQNMSESGSGSGGAQTTSPEQYIYISDTSELPPTAAFGQKAIVTTDGTKNGEILQVLEFDAYGWYNYAAKPNAFIYHNKGTGKYPTYNPEPYTKREYLGYLGLQYRADENGEPVKANFDGMSDISGIRDNKDYVVSQLSITIPNNELKIYGGFKNLQNFSINDEDIMRELFHIKDCIIDSFHVFSAFRNIIIEDVKLGYNFSAVITENMQLKNIGHINNFSLSTSSLYMENLSLSIEGATFDYFSVYCYNPTESLCKMNITFKNVKFKGNISLNQMMLSSLIIEGGFDTTELQNVGLDNLDTTSDTFNNFLRAIIEGGMSEGSVYAYQLPTDVTIDESIRQMYTDKGITLSIEHKQP